MSMPQSPTTPAQRAVRLQRRLGAGAALLAATGVALWAYSSHAPLEPDAARRLGQAAAMALLHGIAGAALAPQAVVGGERQSIVLLLAGALLFSASLVAHEFMGTPTTLAPIGGVAMIAGWVWLAMSRLRR